MLSLDVENVFAKYVEINPDSKAVLDDLWRHVLVNEMNNMNNIGTRDAENKKVMMTSEESQQALHAFIAYALQPPLTPKEYANNYHTRLQTQLDEFTGF